MGKSNALQTGSSGPTPLANAELFIRYQQGDETARGRLLEIYMPLVVKLARRFAFPGSPVPLEDLVVEGNLGLLSAIERFRQDFGCQFSTYAYWWIQHHLYRALMRDSHLIRLPRQTLSDMRKAFAVSRRLFQELERTPTLSEIAYSLEKSISETEDLLQKSACFQHAPSLDEPVSADEGDYCRGDRTPMDEQQIDDQVENALLQQSLRLAVRRLSEAERLIMEMRFGLEGGARQTYEEIEARLGIPRSRIRILERTALHKLKTATQEA